MTLFQIIISIIGGIFAIAASFAGVGYYKQGRATQILDEGNTKLNTNSLLKDQIDALEDKVDRQSEKINSQSDEIKGLTAKVQFLTNSLDEQQKKFAQAILAIEGKDPQIIEFIGMAKSYFELNRPLLDKINHEVVPTVERLGKYLDKQTF